MSQRLPEMQQLQSLTLAAGSDSFFLLQLYKNSEKVAEHIAAEGGKDAIAKVWR